MKFLFSACLIVAVCVSAMSAQTAPPKETRDKEMTARRATRQCVVEEKVTFAVAVAYSKGDLKDQRPKSKCFLKCFAYKLGLFDKETGDPVKEKLLEYVQYLPDSADTQQYADFIDKCKADTEKGEDQCDYVYRAYKCFWDEINKQPEPESVRLSFYDVLGFNQLFDEGEVIEEEAQAAVEELKITPQNADSN